MRQHHLVEVKGMLGNDYWITLSGAGRSLASERLQISKTSVATYLLRAREAGLSWPLPPVYEGEAALQRALFRRVGRPPQDLSEPEWPRVAQELTNGQYVNLELVFANAGPVERAVKWCRRHPAVGRRSPLVWRWTVSGRRQCSAWSRKRSRRRERRRLLDALLGVLALPITAAYPGLGAQWLALIEIVASGQGYSKSVARTLWWEELLRASQAAPPVSEAPRFFGAI
jgi:hypothetical protein